MHTLTKTRSTVRAAATAALAGLSLLLTGCFITPGKFESELVLGPDQSFTFSYEGEIFFLGLSQLAQMGEEETPFEPEPCYVDNSFEERECTANELEGQRADWAAGAERRAAEAKQKAEQMSALLGGIDASDPKATEQFIQLLERQKGFNSVKAKGDGVFDVSYRIDGKLTHDFMFPLIEGVPTTNPFVQILLRDGDIARINAPGFAAQSDDSPMNGMMGGLAGLAGMGPSLGDSEGAGSPGAPPALTLIDGTFTIKTSAGMKILANNTDEGPSETATGEALSWKVDTRTKSAPTALINLGS